MKPVMVLGVGSPFGADRLGWQLIEAIGQHRHCLPETVANTQLVCVDRPGLALLAYIKDAGLAIVLDAVFGGEAGNVRRLQLDQLMLSDSKYSSHTIGVAETLILGSKLDMLPEQLVLYGVEIGENKQAFTVSDEVINRLCKWISGDITSWCYTPA